MSGPIGLGDMRVFALDCFPDPDSEPSVVMIVCAPSEQLAIDYAFGHPNAEQYAAIALHKHRKHKKAPGMQPGIHGFVNWQAFKALG